MVLLEVVLGVLVGVAIVLLVQRIATPNSSPESERVEPIVQRDTNGNTEGSDLLSETLDALSTGVVVTDGAGVEITRNDAIGVIAGSRHGELLLEAAHKRLLERAQRGKTGVETLEFVGPPIKVLEVRSMILKSKTVVITVEDISERSRLERVRTDLVANISHELKTPVGAIAVLAETLQGEPSGEVVNRLAARMVSESHRMARTIDDLIELSRIEMGGEMSTTRVSLVDICREAIDRAQTLADRENISLTLESAGDVTVDGDAHQLVSAIGNLVDNAVQYSNPGGSVEVRVIDRHSHVLVEVQDHGVGIPAASIERIFERFYRVDRARSRGTGGTGLGLSIVRHVASNHGAEVSVVSREGEGSTFSFLIPRGGTQ